MGVHRRTLYRRSAHSRGGVPSSTKLLAKNGDASWHVDKVLLSKCDSEPLVVVVEVIPHGRCDRLRYPVERHRGQQEIAGDPFIEITVGICPRAPLFQNPSGEPSGRIVQRVSERLGLRRLDCLVTVFLLPECLVALAIMSFRCGQWPRPRSSVRSNLQITQVNANHWLGSVQRHEGCNPSTEISPLSTVALVTQATHEAVPQPGDVLIVYAHPTGPFGEPVTRKGRDDDVKGGTVDPVAMWIGQEWHERKQCDERARPAVSQNERNAMPLSSALMNKVDVDAVELRAELMEC